MISCGDNMPAKDTIGGLITQLDRKPHTGGFEQPFASGAHAPLLRVYGACELDITPHVVGDAQAFTAAA